MIELDVIFGSMSDKDKVMPGILQVSADIIDVIVNVQFASADNTPDKVERILREIRERNSEPKAYISGAGMSNVLTGVIKAQATIMDLVIGIPISDSKTNGLSSYLSTSEKPPLNPVLMTGINNSYAAVNIGYKFLKRLNNLEIERKEAVLFQKPDYPDNDADYKILAEELDKIGMKYKSVPLENVGLDDVVLNIFSLNLYDKYLIEETDKKLASGYGIQVGVIRDINVENINYLTKFFHNTKSTGFVGFGAYKNAAIVAAQFTRNDDSLKVVHKQKVEKTKSLEKVQGLLIRGGQEV